MKRTVLLLAAIASGSLAASFLNAGSAHATITCTFGTISSCNGTEGNLTFSNFAVTGSGYQAGDIINIFRVGNLYSIAGDYVDGENPTVPLTGSGNFSFTATATSGYNLISADVDSAVSGSNFAFTNSLTNLPASPLISSGGFPAPPSGMAPFAAGTTSTNVVVAWASTGDTASSSLMDLQVNVPGPLPLLGAATAFGFSRKIRRRIRTASC